MHPGEERQGLDSHGSQEIGVGVGDAGSESLRLQLSQVSGHLGTGTGIRWYPQELGDRLAKPFTEGPASNPSQGL